MHFDSNEFFLASLSIIIILCLSFTTYVAKQASSINSTKLAVFILVLFQIIFTSFFVVVSYESFNLNLIPSIKNMINFLIIKLSVILSIVSIFISILVLFLIIKNVKKGLLFCSIIIFIIILINIGFTSKIAKNSNSMQIINKDNCKGKIEEINENELEKYGCKNKYLEKENCLFKKKSIKWENLINKPINSRIYEIYCLNLNCCPVSNNFYSFSLKKVYLNNLVLNLINFTIFLCICLIFNDENIEEEKIIYEKILFAICIIILIIGSITSILIVNYNPFKEKLIRTLNPNLFTIFKQSKKNLIFYNENIDNQNKNCKEITFYQKNILEDIKKLKLNGKNLQISILTIYGKIFVNPNYNSKIIKIFDKNIQKIIFQKKYKIKHDDFLLFECKFNEIVEFLKNFVNICPSLKNPEKVKIEVLIMDGVKIKKNFWHNPIIVNDDEKVIFNVSSGKAVKIYQYFPNYKYYQGQIQDSKNNFNLKNGKINLINLLLITIIFEIFSIIKKRKLL